MSTTDDTQTPIYSAILEHQRHFLALGPDQRREWYERWYARIREINDMPSETFDEKVAKARAGLDAWQEMDRWTLEQIEAQDQET